MNGRVLLDTNIVIALFARDETVLRELSNAESVFVPSIVLGELFYGAYESRRFDENMTRMEEFASVIAVKHRDDGREALCPDQKPLARSGATDRRERHLDRRRSPATWFDPGLSGHPFRRGGEPGDGDLAMSRLCGIG